MAHSDNAKALIDLAVAIAAAKSGGKQLGARDLFWAVLVTSERRRGEATAAHWLGDWVAQHGATPIALVAADYLGIQATDGRRAMILTGHASAVLARASAIATLTVKRSTYDVRHIVAALTLPDEAGSNKNVLGAARDRLGIELTDFPPHMVEQIAESHEADENLQAWRQLLDRPDAISTPDATIIKKIRTDAVVNLNADRPSPTGPDPLGIATDVSAFARLICLEEATPPLSIGLFGEWGSGKSSFMERLQDEIARLTGKERADRKTRDEDDKRSRKATDPETGPRGEPTQEPRFVENVVQIRFNAWHFADANLWASLTAEFFDQLRRGGHDGLRSSNYLALVGKVADRVRSLEASAQKADGAVVAAAAAAKKAEQALAEAREKLAASDLALASEQLGNALETFQKDNAKSLKDVGTRVYRTDLSKDIDGLKAAVVEASTIPGKIALISRVLAGGGAATWLGTLSVVLFAVIGVMWRYGDPTSLAVLVQRAIGWGGGTLAALGALWQAMAKVRPVLDGAWTYAKAIEAARKQLAAEVKTKEEEAASAAGILATARTEAEKAKAPLAQYGQGAQTSAPGTILRYFLFEDGDVRDYDKHVGLVSRARRSFEQLDAIVAAGRDGAAARKKKARGEALTPKEITALERFEAMQLGDAGLTVPDRIVLYIDDLDRCTHQQVYDVLQAIHLLLAFELFVVVVGVDVRWVEEAVARQFVVTVDDLPDGATEAQHEAARKRAETERRKRAIDYLEKIFQLPFWLRPLTTQGDGASYGVYVRGLLQANLEATGESALAPPKDTSRTKGLAGGVEGLADAFVAPATAALDSIASEETGSLDEALATVKLTQAEVDFLASAEIGALAAKSPRAVKRMINVYRIIRARMSEAELAEFLGHTGKPPTWPIAAFLAAVECGQPVEVADALYDGIKRMDEAAIFDARSTQGIIDQGAEIDSAEAKLAMADALSRRRIGEGIIALNVRRTGRQRSDWATAGEAHSIARIIRRYSFNRYH